MYYNRKKIQNQQANNGSISISNVAIDKAHTVRQKALDC